jgi:LmbE family N-acetylglucosaminyl deacetylase
MTSLDQLGTVLMVWAHPDDETYLAGGVSALLTDAGQRVVCITATRGEAGGDGQVRTVELEQALDVLGVSEHHWLDYPDGGCAEVDADEAVTRIRSIVDEVQPDSVLTFGPDGITGHPDHQTASAWVDHALAGLDVRLLHAVEREERVDRELDEEFGVYELGSARMLPDHEIDLLLRPEGVLLDRKISALLLQKSQTGGLVDAVGIERFSAWAADEAFARPPHHLTPEGQS